MTSCRPPSPAEWAHLLEAAPVLIWASGPDKGGTYFNRVWREFTGRSHDELTGDGWLADVHPDDLPALAACEAAFAQQEPFQTEFRLRHRDGAWHWMLDAGRPRFDADGTFQGYVGACTDITDRKAAEATLAASEARLQLAQDAAGFGTYDWDVVEDRIRWSPEMFRLYAIDPATPAAEVYEAWLRRLHPDDRERANAETRRFVETADHLKIDFRIVLPEGEIRWIEGRGRMFRDDAGKPVRMIGVNFDATEQHRREEALRESEQRLRDIAENFPGIIFRRITHPDGRIEYPYFSGPNEALFHIPREQIEQFRTMEEVAKLIHYDDLREMIVKFEEAASALKPLEIEGRIVAPGGEISWVRSVSRPRPRDDGALIWDGVMLDVTEQHKRESERERAAAMLRMGIGVAGIGTWELDPPSLGVVGSAVTNTLFGLPTDDVPRPLENYLARVHDDDVDEVRRGLAAAIDRRIGTSCEYRIKGADGRILWVSSSGSVVKLADGSERVIGALSDITDRRQREEEREAALERQTTLLRELNHRVKNNLQMITSVLRLQASRMPDFAAAGTFSSAIERVQTISDLHAQLGAEGDLDRIDFGNFLQELCGKLRRSILDGSRIELRCTTRTALLDLDRAVPLGLIVNELVTNALKHAFPESGTGVICVSLERQPDGALRISVSDDGVGMTPGDQPRGLGMRLVDGLGRQVGCTYHRSGGPTGVTHVVTLPTEGS